MILSKQNIKIGKII